jgi:hypothetical protein
LVIRLMGLVICCYNDMFTCYLFFEIEYINTIEGTKLEEDVYDYKDSRNRVHELQKT